MTLQNIIDLFRKQESTPCEMLAIMDGMAARNDARLQAIKDEMGEKYILHPAHKKQRLEAPRPV